MANPNGPPLISRKAGEDKSAIIRSVKGDILASQVREVLLEWADRGELPDSLKGIADALNKTTLRTNQRNPRRMKLDTKKPSRTPAIPVGHWNDKKVHNMLTKLGFEPNMVRWRRIADDKKREYNLKDFSTMRRQLWLDWLWHETCGNLIGKHEDRDGLSRFSIKAFNPHNTTKAVDPADRRSSFDHPSKWVEPWRGSDPKMYYWRDLSQLSEDVERGILPSADSFLMTLCPRSKLVKARMGI